MKNRLDSECLNSIQNLINEGYSLNEISKVLGKSKTTIYYHFRKIKGRTVKPISFMLEDPELLGEFIGLFAGDGSVSKTKDYKYRVYLHFNLKDEIFTENLIDEVLMKLFGKRPMIFTKENRLNLCYYSRSISQLLRTYLVWEACARKTYSVRLHENTYPKSFMIGFLRGCLDSDGHLSPKNISFATVSPGLKDNIVSFLEALSFDYSVRLNKEKRPNRVDIYHIRLFRKEHTRFIKEINPRNKRGLYAPAGIRISERPVP